MIADVAPATHRSRNGRRVLWLCLGAVFVYLVIAVACYWPVAPWSSSRLVLCGCYDPASEAWWLAWTPFAITHHLNLFATNYLDYPVGVNLAQQTDPPLLGFLLWPITATAGPVASLNLALRLALFTSASSMFFVLRRWVRFGPAAFFGGLVYGFGPYVMAEASLHVTLAFVPLPPVMLALVADLVVTRRNRPLRTGLLLGLVAAAQYLISPEILAATALLALIGIAFAGLAYRTEIRRRLRGVVTGLIGAAVPFVVICGYPIYYLLEGANRIAGRIVPLGAAELFSADLFSPFIPTTNQFLGTVSLKATGASFVANDINENGGYLGVALLVVLVYCVWQGRDRIVVWLCAALGISAYLLALGPRLVIDRRITSIPLPFAILEHLPLLENGTPVRYTLFVDLFVAFTLAFGLDAVVAKATSRRQIATVGTASWWTRPAARGLALGGAAIVLLLPNIPFYQPFTGVPTYFFTGSAIQQHVPDGSVVLTYPFPDKPRNEAMLWQAESGMRFRLIGGYGAFPDQLGRISLTAIPLQPETVEDLFLVAANNPATGEGITLPPPADATTLAEIREYCALHDVGSILVQTDHGDDPALAVRYLRAAFGRPNRYDEIDAWFGIQKRLRGPAPGFHPAPRR